MAQIQDNTHKTKPRSSCFLGCFGFSGKVKVPDKKPPDRVKPNNRKEIRWFSRPRLKKSDAKTVPVDAAVSEKANRSRQIAAADKKISSKRHAPAAGNIPAAMLDQIVHEKPQKTRHETDQNIILEVRKKLDHADSSKKDTCPKTVTTKIGSSHFGSPERSSNTDRTTTTVLSPSASFQAPKRKKQIADASENSCGHGEKSPPETDTLTGKFDPIVGFSIIMAVLIIMLVWGRLCAILCTSACLYFVPRFRAITRPSFRTVIGPSVDTENGSNQIGSGLNYDDNKKKVVLEGFLERNNRNTLRNS